MLIFNHVTCTISGATTVGALLPLQTYTITATNSSGATASTTLKLQVPNADSPADCSFHSFEGCCR